ncbi:ABC transporter ATP-binding protein [Streptococcus sciuri]|uniref:ABC transporter ATP-binding protein n=1 Tax=Streptococcus sciuri TaxID=2973939 RepID=A0ABT2F8W3_9STRE|nr:ABC transporter ATP-binding protein [Streptococcus sciuri]MCS4488916.1 ABC transporter ATP-binding protein [Streptococcus sciuri]
METLRVDGLSKNYGNYTAVKDINFTVTSGECLGILGINGAGKTTTLKMIYSANKITSGDVYILGKNIKSLSDRGKSKLGIVAQEDMLDTTLTVFENLIAHGICYGINSKELQKRAKELLEFVQLDNHANKMISELSGGMRRRVVLARALINNPEIIILDEPTVGLDIQSRNIIWNKLEVLKQQGVSIIITSHYMNEIEFLADRIAIIDSGVIKDEGTIDSLLNKYHEKDIEELFLKLTSSSKGGESV